MNIILIGFMGTGKTAVGQVLAEDLGMHFLDTDRLIEITEKKSVATIFKEKGEAYFRKMETEVLKTLQDYDNFIIATGGGIVLREGNVTMLKNLGPLVLLQAKTQAIFERVKLEGKRPLLEVVDPLAEIEKLLALRLPIYKKVADVSIDTSILSVQEVAEQVKQWVKSK